MNDAATIFALSSGAPPAAISIVRVSGPAAGAALLALHGRLPEPRRATLGALRQPGDGDLLDRALLLWLPGPRTATGEDLVELHLHGGRAVTHGVLSALGGLPSLRPAEPGEFTRRAFLNGVIDLAQAEGLADLISAETELQRRHALLNAGGSLSRRVAGWQARIIALSAKVEAMLEFAEGDDVPEAEWCLAASDLAGDLAAVLSQPPAERLRDGVRVALAGPPNAGKSTLLNAITGREAAITAPTAGTTRDLIEVPVAISGVPFLFVDTAGIRQDEVDDIEREGIVRAFAAIQNSDILLWLGEPDEMPEHRCPLRLHARSDERGREGPCKNVDIHLSARTGAGMQKLIRTITEKAYRLLPVASEASLNLRQRNMLADCLTCLRSAASMRDPLFAAEELRNARVALDRVTGQAGTENMLAALFGRFCIGK